ncbi:glutaminase A [Paenibacillus flagellatus]|uniref:Glutaminase n=1 Tax=Paenibacillus flagellatus TaxID=2211139 RepID=A0A2V5K205_9BACL|nr:glutaminase A [Paenibacillus flagellatus]PYI51553.1 glutaminase A [Paenibacillus flagellatus]
MTTDFRDLSERLPGWVEAYRAYAAEGGVATYIPELAHAPQRALGITLHHRSGTTVSAGDADLPFTLQSISKVFTLLLALMDRGERAVFEKVGMEPTGDVFNSMLKLELVQPGKPFNPLINAGAIVVSSLLLGDSPEEKSQRILRFVRELAGDDGPAFNEDVYRSEAETANRNRSLAYFLKDNKVLDEDVEPTLDVYFRQCAIEVTCAQVARMGLVLANDGVDPATGRELVPRRFVRIAKSFMVTCGMYNASGEFAIQVGIPAKSGVSGGILALVPGELGIGLIGPALNDKGNSIAGVHLLKLLSERYDWSLF